MAFETWADHPSEIGRRDARSLDRRRRRQIDVSGGGDRRRERVIEGPRVKCCRRTRIAADMLVRFHELAPAALGKLRERFNQFRDVPPADIYICDSCRETLRREGVFARDELPRVVRRR